MVFSYTKKVTQVEGRTRTMLGPRLAVIWLVADTSTVELEYIPLVEALQAFFPEDLFDNIPHTFVARVGVISLKTCPHNLVGVSGTASKHLANGA